VKTQLFGFVYLRTAGLLARVQLSSSSTGSCSSARSSRRGRCSLWLFFILWWLETYYSSHHTENFKVPVNRKLQTIFLQCC